MFLATDYVGISTLITATAAALVTLIVAWRQGTTHKTLNAVQEQVTPENGTKLATLVENDALHKLADEGITSETPIVPPPT